jgi:SAM-dependent methyltransferase
MNDATTLPADQLRETVRNKYAQAALRVVGGDSGCCGGSAGCGGDPITSNHYGDSDAAAIPADALKASLGCGNPTALAELKLGEVVLDLGSGGGIDVLLSARRVGPAGFVYGLDMTDEMLALAEKNRTDSGLENVKFLKGHIEEIPLPDNSVDVIISNCVINLSGDKDRVLCEAFRVLKPGGRFAVSDVVVEGEMPAALRRDIEAFVGCVSGALEKDEYIRKLERAGFSDITIQPTRRYTLKDAEASGCCLPSAELLTPQEKSDLDGRVMSAFVRGVKGVG